MNISLINSFFKRKENIQRLNCPFKGMFIQPRLFNHLRGEGINLKNDSFTITKARQSITAGIVQQFTHLYTEVQVIFLVCMDLNYFTLLLEALT